MKPQMRKFGNSAILFDWFTGINNIEFTTLASLETYLLGTYRDEISEIVVAYTSLAVYFNEGVDIDNFINSFDHGYETAGLTEKMNRTWMVPVCYANEFAPDIGVVAKHNNITEKEVVQLHTSCEYQVRFIGFLPGFPYLSGLDHRLYTPRRSQPRNLIESGSVAIGGEQTGIYTMPSPGGWNVIGKSPLQFFNVSKAPPSLLAPGDHIRFRSVDLEVFRTISDKVSRGLYDLEEVNHD
jgi:inhibitor of KinA